MHLFNTDPSPASACNPPLFSALVFEKWRDGDGQAWAHVTYNGVSCVVGDAVARQVLHPRLQQPLHVFPMESLEQALDQVCSAPLSPSFALQPPPNPAHFVFFTTIFFLSIPHTSESSAAKGCVECAATHSQLIQIAF